MLKSLSIVFFFFIVQVLSGRASAQDITPPERPLIRYVTVDSSNNDVLIYWDPTPSPDVEWYSIYYEVQTVNGPEGIKIDSVDASSLSYRHSGTSASSENLFYSITAIDSSGNESLRTPGFHSTVHVEASYNSCANSMLVKWNKYIGWEENISGYRVYRSIDHGIFENIEGFNPQDTSFTDHDIPENTQFHYYIEAVKNDGLISSSNVFSKFTFMPPPPSDLELIYVTVAGQNTVNISFSFDPISQVKDFTLLRSSVDSSDFVPLAYAMNVSALPYTFTDEVTSSLKSYFYKIGALNSCQEVISTSNPGVNILLKADTTGREVILNWNPYVFWNEGVSSYHIFRKSQNGDFEEIGQVPPGLGSFTINLDQIDANTLSGNHIYRVEAHRNGANDILSVSNELVVNIPSIIEKIPNAFTPNNDGLNDTFRPLLDFFPENYLFIIYDRYGIPVFKTERPGEGWDGRINGKQMAIAGVYIYHLQYTSFNGTRNRKTGKVTLFLP